MAQTNPLCSGDCWPGYFGVPGAQTPQCGGICPAGRFPLAFALRYSGGFPPAQASSVLRAPSLRRSIRVHQVTHSCFPLAHAHDYLSFLLSLSSCRLLLLRGFLKPRSLSYRSLLLGRSRSASQLCRRLPLSRWLCCRDCVRSRLLLSAAIRTPDALPSAVLLVSFMSIDTYPHRN